MESLNYLIYLFLYFYLGIICYLTYQIFFYYQKGFILVKTIIFFMIQAIIYIKISNNNYITLKLAYIIAYIIGIYISKYIYSDYIRIKNMNLKNNTKIIGERVRYYLVILFIPDIIYLIYCFNTKRKYYHKYPHKRKSIYNLFN